ncbi:N-acetylmuramoyl-L-alanine amidase [Turicibacter sanguinis]|uniref:N-acetylmuramoyl-L-alanine amidase n=1 Tax=Turicibacter sanguinis TaxID=154288 RepID=UPI0006C07A06|nr:N-acetylmuramoyl-L-alanine amidase [Turicibacter sanguinis]CUN16245.1 N-acetylmuramoyl-L-alanine amidase LytC precursor [Turicibacter sanguinis]
MTTPILVLDAGHGLNTAGKQTISGPLGIIKEWTLNDAVVRKIIELLYNYDVKIYRTDDVTGKSDLSLGERVRLCNSYNPDLFVSIHHNAGGGTGTEVFWHTKGTSADKKVASIVAPKLASMCGVTNRGVKQAQLGVLACKATAILVEGGFMDHKGDYELITSDYGQKLYAKAVAEAIIEYLGLKKKQEFLNTLDTPQISESFKVKITCTELNIRQSDSFDSKIVGIVRKGEIFTITQESNGLGKLKSGVGWISLNSKYVKRT